MKADLPEIAYQVIEDKTFREILQALSEGKGTVELSGLVEPARSFFLALVQRLTGKKMAYIVPGDGELEFHSRNIASFTSFLGGAPERVAAFPSLEADPYNLIPPHLQAVCERMAALYRILNGEADTVILTLRSLLNILHPPETFRDFFVTVRRDENVSMEDFMEKLLEGGFRPSDIVTSAGEFAKRGGIIDLFQPGDEVPVRVEFSGNEIESLRTFDVNSQLSIEKLEKLQIRPASEIPLNTGSIEKVLEYLRVKSGKGKAGKKGEEVAEKIRTQKYYPGIEGLGKIMTGQGATIFDYLRDFLIVVDDPLRAEEDLLNTYAELEDNYRESESPLFPEPSELFADPKEITARIIAPDMGISDLATAGESTIHHSILSRPVRNFTGQVGQFIAELKRELDKGMRVVCMMNSGGTKERLKEILREQSISFSEEPEEEARDLTPLITVHRIHSGFELPERNLVVHAEGEIFGRERARIEKASSHKTFASDFRDLKIGDFIVHVDHGIGKYAGLVKPGGSAGERDFMLLLYAGGDRLYLPVDRLELVQRYGGAEGKKVALDRLGGLSWSRTKKKARKAIEHLARELLHLYAERQVLKGYSYSPDTEWQEEFEKGFPYEETPDQLRSVGEIKRDMEDDRVMDRLLCGDVGFGKTEVAMRAAFKAVMEEKQVALLAPTTVLASQHYNNFRTRFSPFPVKVEMLSRFRTQAEQKEIVRKLGEGNIDIVIGTHRLLSKDVSFKRLGLLVVDEEQRFGVSHKEKLKMMARSIDVLSMTATPIPRTLQMSLGGVRDMSIIETPPANRMSIQTNLIPFRRGVIGSAIRKELRRGGQVYFVHNRVESLPAMARRLKEICPEARIVAAHGKLRERELEKTMLRFISGEHDVLLSTTIIENGLDIPRVNTIIINRADRFGLAQLYQLRGRVGRSDVKAYAYLLIPPLRSISPVARRRLRALQDFSDLGSGFRLAAMDLEIRGAGELLGTKQHGHIASLGFELYIKMLERAVQELKGEPVKEPVPVKINLGIEARIPDHFIPAQNLRLAFYKRITSAETHDELEEIRKEMKDRYGAFPEPVENFFRVADLKLFASEVDLREIDLSDGRIVLSFGAASPVSAERIVDFVCEHKGASMTPSGQIMAPPPEGMDRLEWVKMVIKNLL